jgi:hypothetical protein
MGMPLESWEEALLGERLQLAVDEERRLCGEADSLV